MDKISQKNRQKFLKLKKFGFPLGQYAITGSGPMGIRNLSAIADIDIIVNSELWNELATRYGIIDTGQIKKIVLPDEIIEVMGEDSFYNVKKDSNAPTVSDRIAQAEIIEGLPFESLEHVLYFKRKMGREKDLKDIIVIEAWQKSYRD